MGRVLRDCKEVAIPFRTGAKRYAALRPREGSPPSTPDIGSLDLEKLLSLRNRVQCTWLRHEPLLFVTTLNRALLS